MATLKVTNIVKIENTTGEDIVFTPYRQNFLYTLGNGETIEFRTNSPEQSLFYYKSILPIANVELVDSFDDQNKLNCFWLCIIDLVASIFYSKLVFYIFNKLAQRSSE